MNGDVVRLSSAVRARLSRLGANVPHADAPRARRASSGELTHRAVLHLLGGARRVVASDVGLRLAMETQVHEYDVSSLAALHSPDAAAPRSTKLARYKRLCGPKDMAIEPDGARRWRSTRPGCTRQAPCPRVWSTPSLASLLVLLQRGSGLAPRAEARRALSRAQRRADAAALLRLSAAVPREARRARPRDAPPRRRRSSRTTPTCCRCSSPASTQKLAPARAAVRSSTQVRAVVARRMSGERPSIAKVARELSLSPRTLQRRLGELGVSYQRVLDEVRHHTALRLLRTEGASTSARSPSCSASRRLNSFTRAFRAWEGTTPNRWRDSMSCVARSDLNPLAPSREHDVSCMTENSFASMVHHRKLAGARPRPRRRGARRRAPRRRLGARSARRSR